MKNFKLLLFAFILLTIGCNKESIEDNSKEEVDIDLRQYYMGDVDFTFVTDCDIVEGIRVFIDPCFDDSPYEAAIPAALQQYNNAQILVSYVIVNSIQEADLVFECNEGGCCGCANAAFPDPDNPGDFPPNLQTTFPSGGTIGSGISLDVNWNNCICEDNELNQCFFMHTVMHELAHTLGFYHNDDLGEVPIHVEGTPTGFDPGSIINSANGENANGTFCDAECEFNENDMIALLMLYPCDYDPQFFGPSQLCVNESGQYCLSQDIECANITWFGHPDINGSTENCVTLSYDQPGTFTIYADIHIGGCRYNLSQEIQVGAPNILNDLTVLIDPCFDIITITGDPTSTYNWGSFNFSYPTSPNIAVNNSIVNIRTPLIAGEEFCFMVESTSNCGTSSLPCEVCYTIPSCRNGTREESATPATPNNACFSNSQCPQGYSCQDGICCEDAVNQGDMCVTDDHCPTGYECVSGNCCHILTGSCL